MACNTEYTHMNKHGRAHTLLHKLRDRTHYLQTERLEKVNWILRLASKWHNYKQKIIVGLLIWFYQVGIQNIVQNMQNKPTDSLWHWLRHYEQSLRSVFYKGAPVLCCFLAPLTYSHTHLIPPQPGFNCLTEWDVGVVESWRRRSGAQGQSGPSDVHQNDRYPCFKTLWPTPKPSFPPFFLQTHKRAETDTHTRWITRPKK